MSINFSSQAVILQEILPLIHSKSKIIMFSSISGQKGVLILFMLLPKEQFYLVKSMVSQIPKGATINAIAPSLIEESSMYFAMKKTDEIFIEVRHKLDSF